VLKAVDVVFVVWVALEVPTSVSNVDTNAVDVDFDVEVALEVPITVSKVDTNVVVVA